MEQRATWLTAPPLQNSSCNHPRYSNIRSMTHLTVSDVTQATLVFLLSAGILIANVMVIIVINSKRYSKYIHSQPRYLLTSLASNDLAIGLMVTPFGFLPALYRCWPYSELFCQIQVGEKSQIVKSNQFSQLVTIFWYVWAISWVTKSIPSSPMKYFNILQ